MDGYKQFSKVVEMKTLMSRSFKSLWTVLIQTLGNKHVAQCNASRKKPVKVEMLQKENDNSSELHYS